jgi:hypothetical protein
MKKGKEKKKKTRRGEYNNAGESEFLATFLGQWNWRERVAERMVLRDEARDLAVVADRVLGAHVALPALVWEVCPLADFAPDCLVARSRRRALQFEGADQSQLLLRIIPGTV